MSYETESHNECGERLWFVRHKNRFIEFKDCEALAKEVIRYPNDDEVVIYHYLTFKIIIHYAKGDNITAVDVVDRELCVCDKG